MEMMNADDLKKLIAEKLGHPIWKLDALCETWDEIRDEWNEDEDGDVPISSEQMLQHVVMEIRLGDIKQWKLIWEE